MVVETFIASLEAEKGYSRHTLRAYRTDVFSFIRFYLKADEDHDPENLQQSFLARAHEVGRLDIRAYLAQLVKEKKAKRTLSRRLSALKAFFDFMVRSGHLDASPAEAIPFPKLEKTIPKFLSIDDMFRLLDSIPAGTWMEKRNLAMFETFYSTGMRISELNGMNMRDVDFKTRVIRVFGKGSKERLVPIGSRALDAIKNYRAVLRENHTPVIFEQRL